MFPSLGWRFGEGLQDRQLSPACGAGMGWWALDYNIANVLEFTLDRIKVKRNGLKFPKIHLTLSKHFHLLDLYFTSVFCVSSHGQILKPENFWERDFVLSHQLSTLYWSLSSMRTWWLVVASWGGRSEPLWVSAGDAEHSPRTLLSCIRCLVRLGLTRVTPDPWRSGGCKQTYFNSSTIVRRMSHRHWE